MNDSLLTTTHAIVRAERLYKNYKKSAKNIQALDSVSFDVRKGEILSIIGRSGAGKSTLLSIIGGLDRPTKGRVLLDRVDLYSLRDSVRSRIRNERIGFVFQFYHLLPEFSVLENVMLPALMRRVRKTETENIKERASTLLKRVGLKNRIDHRPRELSGGEAQRVAIARSLINDPEIVLCDEPTGNLDSKTSAEIHSLIRELNRDKHITFVIATHEPTLAETASRTLYIKDGKLADHSDLRGQGGKST